MNGFDFFKSILNGVTLKASNCFFIVTTATEKQQLSETSRKRITKNFKEELDMNQDGYLDTVCDVKFVF